MGINRYKLGNLIEAIDKRNIQGDYVEKDVRGISTDKIFIETKANLDGVSLNSYKIVHQDEFAYVADTSRRGDKIAIAFNDSKDCILISSIYTVFRVSRNDIIDSSYLFLFFNRPEFDRYSRFNSWGSARETFNWDDLCDIDIEIPSLEIQQKYVDIYKAMLKNQHNYERGLDDLRLVCDGFIDKLRSTLTYERIGNYLELSNETNVDDKYGLSDVRGVSIDKSFIYTKADMQDVSLKQYNIIRPRDFAYVTVTSRNGNKISLAYNDSLSTYICSSSYIVFRCKDKLLPQYLRMYFERSEFNRYARFKSWGSARETFDYSEMENVHIPIPSIDIQKSIAEIFALYSKRKDINELLKIKIKSICPILIKGSILEARKQS